MTFNYGYFIFFIIISIVPHVLYHFQRLSVFATIETTTKNDFFIFSIFKFFGALFFLFFSLKNNLISRVLQIYRIQKLAKN